MRDTNKKARSGLALGVSLVALSMSAPATAQGLASEAEQHEQPEIQEIVVTATKRTESLQDVPAAIQAISSATLDRLNAASMQDIFNLMPGVNSSSTGEGSAQFNIRGVQGLSQAPTSTSTVGYYMDETPLTEASGSPDVALFDLDRVEVLRGPQGTLYGEGALGGAIRLITKKPRLNVFEGRLLGELSKYRRGEIGGQLAGMANIPVVVDKVGLRMTASYVDRGGYLDNAQTGNDDENRRRTFNLRGLLRITPTDGLDIDATYMRQDYAGRGDQFVSELAGDYAYLSHFTARVDDESDLFNITGRYRTNSVEVVSSTSLFKRTRAYVSDARDLYEIVRSGLGFLPPTGVVENGLTAEKTFTQEVRLASAKEGSLRWIIGAWYKHRELDSTTTDAVPEIAFILPPDGVFFDRRVSQTFAEKALFGELSYDIDAALTITGGARLFDNSFDGSRSLSQAGVSFPAQAAEVSSKGALYKASLDYKLTDRILLYGLFSQGIRGGGLNIISANRPNEPSYGPDKTDNFEVGLKSTWLNGALRLNVAAYLIKWHDIQVNVLPSPGNSFITNGDEASSKGLEVEANIRPYEGVHLGASLTLSRAVTDERFNLGGFETPEPNDDVYAEKGTRLPFSPKLKVNLFAEYSWELSPTLDANARVDWSHIGSRPNSLRTNGELNSSGYLEFGSYGTFDLRAGVSSKRWSLSAYVRNLTDERAILGGFYPTIGGVLINEPRSIGASVRYEM